MKINSLATHKPVALGFRSILGFKSILEFRNVIFVEGGKKNAEYPNKNTRDKDENQQWIHPTSFWLPTGIEFQPHWWEASALAATLSLLPQILKIQNKENPQNRKCSISELSFQRK